MKRRAILVVLLSAATLASNCDEITTENTVTLVTVTVTVSSGVIDATGDMLVRDQVQFSASIGEGQDAMPAPARYQSTVPGVVQIVNPATGTARFVDIGTATVRAVVTDPTFGNDSLDATIQVTVDSFEVTINPSSPTFNASGRYLVGDVIDYDAVVIRASDEH